jgi:hypothetical protein
MRTISLLLLSAAIGSCTAGPPQPIRTAQAETQYQSLIAGKVAQAPVTCLPSYNANDMITIDGRTLAFRVGSRTTYIMQLSQGCELAGSPGYALLSRQFGGTGLCRGDIQQVIDPVNRMTVGSCSIKEIVPYAQQ